MPTNTIDYHREIYPEHKMLERSQEFYQWIDLRRTVRDFSDKPVPKKVMENIIMAASTAPSGAHKQPWTFCLVKDAKLKSVIRKAAEEEEYINYHGRMSEEWLKDLNPLQTNWDKEFIDTVPWLIVVFKRAYEKVNGKIKNNYYVSESVGIAAGFLLAAIHHAGLVALTHTPSPMNFLNKILKRPDNERPFLLIPVGYPADNVKVPDLKRKQLKEVLVYY